MTSVFTGKYDNDGYAELAGAGDGTSGVEDDVESNSIELNETALTPGLCHPNVGTPDSVLSNTDSLSCNSEASSTVEQFVVAFSDIRIGTIDPAEDVDSAVSVENGSTCDSCSGISVVSDGLQPVADKELPDGLRVICSKLVYSCRLSVAYLIASFVIINRHNFAFVAS